MSRHVVLLGDSIFDNAAYTGREPDVVQHLRSILPSGWRASLLAVDGAVTFDLSSQVSAVPADATDLVVSIGGNDALGNSDMLALRVRSTAEALDLFHSRVQSFEESYRSAIEEVLDRPGDRRVRGGDRTGPLILRPPQLRNTFAVPVTIPVRGSRCRRRSGEET